VETLLKPLVSEVNGAVEIFMNMSKMFALKLEGAVVAAKNASEDALVPAFSRILQFTHPLLQCVVGSRETLQNCFRVRGSASNVIALSVRINDGELVFVRDIRMTLTRISFRHLFISDWLTFGMYPGGFN
jgi:hypothetical protein